ncbi:hypothetical protein [Candidatus Palauibacter sp.]|uniref:hypothetical protein n=1 Tax=Candidatus Palauibacter sp. TaxID=3101350 RepID=UPI003CC65B2C
MDIKREADRRADSLLVQLAAKPWTALGLVIAAGLLVALGWLLAVLVLRGG